MNNTHTTDGADIIVQFNIITVVTLGITTLVSFILALLFPLSKIKLMTRHVCYRLHAQLYASNEFAIIICNTRTCAR